MGMIVYLNDAPVMYKSATYMTVALSVMEAELSAEVTAVQGMVHGVMTSLGLKVRLPMKLEPGDIRAVDLVNRWSVRGCTRHADKRSGHNNNQNDNSQRKCQHMELMPWYEQFINTVE